MRAKKIVLMPLMIMLALSISGVAFAHWSDHVRIEGTVEMGSLTIAIDKAEPPHCIEYYQDPVTGDLVEGEWLGKDVASCTITRADLIRDPHTEKEGYKKAIWTITNAYPQYICHYTNVKIHNIGTLPAHFVEIIVTGYDNTDGEDLVFEWIKPYKIGVFKNDVDGDGDLENIINVEIVNFVCHQLDPCDTTKGEIDIDFKQEAEECHTYTFLIEIIAVQWNKAID